MSNAPNTVKSVDSVVAKAAAQMLADEVQFVKAIEKEDPSIFGQNFQGAQPGNTVVINKPARFIMGTTADITSSIQDVVEQKATLTLDQVANVPIALTSSEIATDLALKQWSKRILAPAMSTIAQGIDAAVIKTAVNATANFVGTPGTTPGSTLTYLQAKQKIYEAAAPRDNNLFCLVNSAAQTAMVDARKGYFQSSEDIAKQYREGYIGQGDGFTYLNNDLLPVFTTGTQAGYANALSNGATQSGATIAIDTMTGSATITKGTVVTFGGVYEIHPITKAVYPYLKQFVVTADVTLSGGAGNLAISPSLDAGTTGTQNASATVADESVVTFVSGTAASTSYGQNIAFHKQAVRFCSAPLVLPDGTDMAAQETVDGITVRVIRDYLPLTDKMVMRLDVLYGLVVVRPEWLCRITG